MSGEADDRSLLNYTTLLYIYPAAALVNNANAMLTPGSVVGLAIVMLAFAFIPVELYSSYLWQVAEGTVAGEATLDNPVRRTLLGTVDTLRIFFLMAAYLTLDSVVLDKSGKTIFIGSLSAFFVLNWCWNKIVSPVDREVLRRFEMQTVAELNRQNEPLNRTVFDLFFLAVRGLQKIQRLFLGQVFPLLGLCGVLIVLTVAVCGQDQCEALHSFVGTAERNLIAITIAVLGVQVAIKAAQIGALTVIIQLVKRHRAAAGYSDESERKDMHQWNGGDVFEVDLHTGGTRRSDWIAMRDIHEFRANAYVDDRARTYPGMRQLVSDRWDESSCHFCVLQGEAIVGTLRFTRAVNGRLPVSTQVENLDVARYGELSRLIVAPDHRQGKVALALICACALLVRNESHGLGLIIDSVLTSTSAISPSTYRRWGFEELGREYFDSRYALPSTVLALEPGSTKFTRWARAVQRRLVTRTRKEARSVGDARSYSGRPAPRALG